MTPTKIGKTKNLIFYSVNVFLMLVLFKNTAAELTTTYSAVGHHTTVLIIIIIIIIFI